MEVSSQVRSAQQRVEVDSVIEIDVATVKTTTDKAGQSGPSREREYYGDNDSLFDFPTDSGIDTNRASFPRQNDGPFMTTRRF